MNLVLRRLFRAVVQVSLCLLGIFALWFISMTAASLPVVPR